MLSHSYLYLRQTCKPSTQPSCNHLQFTADSVVPTESALRDPLLHIKRLVVCKLHVSSFCGSPFLVASPPAPPFPFQQVPAPQTPAQLTFSLAVCFPSFPFNLNLQPGLTSRWNAVIGWSWSRDCAPLKFRLPVPHFLIFKEARGNSGKFR